MSRLRRLRNLLRRPWRECRRRVAVAVLARLPGSIATNSALSVDEADRHSGRLRKLVRAAAGLPLVTPRVADLEDGLLEFRYLLAHRQVLAPMFQRLAGKRLLVVGQAYYYGWYLTRALRRLGWFSELLNWDTNPASQIYYHGEDHRFFGTAEDEAAENLAFYLKSVYAYDVFHFSNTHGLCFGLLLQNEIAVRLGPHQEIHLLRDLGKKIVYTNNGCLDGVSQTSFASWGGTPVCAICRWRDVPSVCSDARNLEWGRFRNSVADFQCLLGGNRVDFNDAPTVHEVPEFFCLRPDLWDPSMEIPEQFRLPLLPTGVRLYHGMGQRSERTDEQGVNIKCSHIYRPVIERLRREGYTLELSEPTDVPNRDVRFIQAQSDIFLDMLTYGWFGATAREGMMLGKPVVAFIRPEWLDSLREEVPDYAAELPIVHATPETVEAVLRELIEHPEKRKAIGERSRAFAIKWHGDEAGARRFDQIYRGLLLGDTQLRLVS